MTVQDHPEYPEPLNGEYRYVEEYDNIDLLYHLDHLSGVLEAAVFEALQRRTSRGDPLLDPNTHEKYKALLEAAREVDTEEDAYDYTS